MLRLHACEKAWRTELLIHIMYFLLDKISIKEYFLDYQQICLNLSHSNETACKG